MTTWKRYTLPVSEEEDGSPLTWDEFAIVWSTVAFLVLAFAGVSMLFVKLLSTLSDNFQKSN